MNTTEAIHVQTLLTWLTAPTLAGPAGRDDLQAVAGEAAAVLAARARTALGAGPTREQLAAAWPALPNPRPNPASPPGGSAVPEAAGQPTRGLVSVGYASHTGEQLVAALAAAGVQLVADVRATPYSRRPGFSRPALAEALRRAGIGYRHYPALGNPRDNRAGLRAGDPGAVAAFEQQLATPAAGEALDELAGLAGRALIGLLCVEADEHTCHRRLIRHALTTRGAQPAPLELHPPNAGHPTPATAADGGGLW